MINSLQEKFTKARRTLFARIFETANLDRIHPVNSFEKIELVTRDMTAKLGIPLTEEEDTLARQRTNSLTTISPRYDVIFFISGNPTHYGHIFTAEESAHQTNSIVHLFVTKGHYKKRGLPEHSDRLNLAMRLATGSMNVSVENHEFEGERIAGLEYYSSKFRNFAQLIGSDVLGRYSQEDRGVFAYPYILFVRSPDDLETYPDIVRRFVHLEIVRSDIRPISSTSIRKRLISDKIYPPLLRQHVMPYLEAGVQ
ncbi:hypothetical protein J4211_05100 [Candidatus Woesearchaeota archaeon]|nr:hypothetical protein [Candidatus Woesearchaeota archaeon]